MDQYRGSLMILFPGEPETRSLTKGGHSMYLFFTFTVSGLP
jgi:hypothetical protein